MLSLNKIMLKIVISIQTCLHKYRLKYGIANKIPKKCIIQYRIRCMIPHQETQNSLLQDILYHNGIRSQSKLTAQTMNFTSIFKQSPSQHNHCIRYGRCGFTIVQTVVTIQDKRTLFVCCSNLLSEINALDCGRQVYFSGSEPSQHDGRYAKVNGIANVTFGKVHGAATVQYEHPAFVTRRQFSGQPVAADTNF